MTTAFQRLALAPLLDPECIAEILRERQHVDSLEVSPWVGTESGTDAALRDERLRRATDEARAILGREMRGEQERPQFRGALAALRALDAFRLDGAAIGVSSVWDLIDPKSTGRTESVPSQVERVAVVAREWAACLADGWVLVTSPARAALSPAQARAVCVWVTLGVPGTMRPLQSPQALSGEGCRQKQPRDVLPVRGRPRDGQQVDRHDTPEPSEVAAVASAEFGVTVPTGHVIRIRAAGIGELYRRLHGRGLVPLDRRMDAMQDERIWDCAGWKEIATFLGCAERTARRMASRAEHPLPVSRVMAGSVVAVRADLAAWTRDEMERGRRHE